MAAQKQIQSLTVPVTVSGNRVFGTEDLEGYIALTNEKAEAFAKEGKPFFLLKQMTEPEDVEIMGKASAVCTVEGGPTCHAAIVCVTKGVPCLTSLRDISIYDEYIKAQNKHIDLDSIATISSNKLTLEAKSK